MVSVCLPPEPPDPDEQAASDNETTAAPAIAATMRDFFTSELLCFFQKVFAITRRRVCGRLMTAIPAIVRGRVVPPQDGDPPPSFNDRSSA
ncbi:hypothetical protein GCM10028798_08100 [Humibacter antri]